MDYTSKELEYIKNNRIEDKPFFYNSTTDQSDVISDDFEAYLILQKVASKQKLLQRLRKNIKDNNNYADRDLLLTEMINNISSNSDKMIAELDAETENFSEFKQSILDEDRRFDELKELNRLISVINTSISELSFKRDQVFQDSNVCLLINDKMQTSKSDDKTKKEYDVWQKVISSYKGK